MGVKIPAYHLRAANDLPEMRKRLKGQNGGATKETANISLTSLIDVFSVILFFLIQSFSATGEIFLVGQGISLPKASHAKELKRAPLVTITQDKVALEGGPVGDNKDIIKKVEDTDWALPQLQEQLLGYKQFFESMHPGEKFPGEIIVQADKELPFLYLKRVMFTLVKIGFADISLAVRGESTGAYKKPEEGEKPASGAR